MRSGILIGLILTVVCAWAAAGQRPELFSRGDIIIASEEDPNGAAAPAGADPNRTWDPAEHLAADWESISVSMTSRLYNPAREPEGAVLGPQWSLSMASIVDIIDGAGLIGWSTSPTSVQAFDPEGRMVAGSAPRSSLVRHYQQPRSWSMPAGFPGELYVNRFSLSLPMDPNAAYPTLFRRVEWTMNVLATEETRTVDIPFQASDTWVELTPGMEIMVEQATVEQGKYQYRIKVKYDSTKVGYLTGGSVSLWQDRLLPPAAVLNIDVLNAEGKSIRSLGGSGGFSSGSSASGSNNQMTGTASGSGSCDACGTAATIRYTLAFNLYEQEARFVLENVPVPEF